MDGPLAQLIALIAYGNCFIRGDDSDALKIERENSAFQFVQSVKFVRYINQQSQQGLALAQNVAEWFYRLRSEGAQRLWYIAFSSPRQELAEYQAVAFANGVPRAIQVDYSSRFELWYPAWSVGDRNAADRRIWNVEYKALPSDHSVALRPSLASAKTMLLQNLEAAREFSARSMGSTTPWPGIFAAALQTLESSDPQMTYHTDLLLYGSYGLAARQLLAAADQASVFGGMGSWNDLGFADEVQQAEYLKVTQSLYDAVKISFVAAVNADLSAA